MKKKVLVLPKKNRDKLLSILLILAIIFPSCKSIIPNNTTVAVKSQRLTDVKLTEKRVLVVSYDSELTREFAISLKNYVRDELKNHKIVAERINIRKNEEDDIADFNKLKSEFKPDYLLNITFSKERTRDFYLIGKTVKKLRGMTASFNLMPCIPETEGRLMWTSEAVINHFYDNEGVVTSKKIAKELGLKMKADFIVN
jgi:hypothetical protein